MRDRDEIEVHPLTRQTESCTHACMHACMRGGEQARWGLLEIDSQGSEDTQVDYGAAEPLPSDLVVPDDLVSLLDAVKVCSEMFQGGCEGGRKRVGRGGRLEGRTEGEDVWDSGWEEGTEGGGEGGGGG